MRVDYSDEAADALDFYEVNDPEVYNAADDIIELLEKDDTNPILRRRMIRPAGSYVVKMLVRPQRNRDYYLFWMPEENQTVAFVKHVGPGQTKLW